MMYTMEGTKVRQEWIPLSMANGIEWSHKRAGHKDRFDNLYRFKLSPLCYGLWLVGALIAMAWRPEWVVSERSSEL